MNKYCDHCDWLSLTEERQRYLRYRAKTEGLVLHATEENHYCNMYRKKLLHFNEHPLIPRLPECIKAEIETDLKAQLENDIEIVELKESFAPGSEAIVHSIDITYSTEEAKK